MHSYQWITKRVPIPRAANDNPDALERELEQLRQRLAVRGIFVEPLES